MNYYYVGHATELDSKTLSSHTYSYIMIEAPVFMICVCERSFRTDTYRLRCTLIRLWTIAGWQRFVNQRKNMSMNRCVLFVHVERWLKRLKFNYLFRLLCAWLECPYTYKWSCDLIRVFFARTQTYWQAPFNLKHRSTENNLLNHPPRHFHPSDTPNRIADEPPHPSNVRRCCALCVRRRCRRSSCCCWWRTASPTPTQARLSRRPAAATAAATAIRMMATGNSGTSNSNSGGGGGGSGGNMTTIAPASASASDFKQWLHAMKMVARLPGGMPPEFRRKVCDNCFSAVIDLYGICIYYFFLLLLFLLKTKKNK